MKARTLKELVNKIDDDADICVLLWEKSAYDYLNDEEVTLTDSAWEKVCDEFDETDFISVGEWITDAVIEYAEINKDIATS